MIDKINEIHTKTEVNSNEIANLKESLSRVENSVDKYFHELNTNIITNNLNVNQSLAILEKDHSNRVFLFDLVVKLPLITAIFAFLVWGVVSLTDPLDKKKDQQPVAKPILMPNKVKNTEEH